ncbi:hypothetical protein E2C01_068215 [Portunus trituberculatus]|uniref:Uncharacterized protein n=1 Tax=Portunus trituberculatus TaxID=210409 RepID=A0A5B7HZG2_PORTR|nr:hypothetical protein [Portunus trituberculatus]
MCVPGEAAGRRIAGGKGQCGIARSLPGIPPSHLLPECFLPRHTAIQAMLIALLHPRGPPPGLTPPVVHCARSIAPIAITTRHKHTELKQIPAHRPLPQQTKSTT